MHDEKDSVGIGLYDAYTVTDSDAIAELVAIDAEPGAVTDTRGDLLADTDALIRAVLLTDLKPVLVRLMSAEAVFDGDPVDDRLVFTLADPVMVPRCVGVWAPDEDVLPVLETDPDALTADDRDTLSE